MGTDLCQYAKHGAETYGIDFSITHLNHARENFALRGLKGYFCLGDGENLPYPDSYFDVIYSNGVIHHSPDTQKMIDEMFRVLKPGGVIKIMVYARNSWQFWIKLIRGLWLKNPEYANVSINEVMSRTVEVSAGDAAPLVKVYSGKKIKSMFTQFKHVNVQKRQLNKCAFNRYLQWLPINVLQYAIGWNLIITATKPAYDVKKVNVQSQLKTQHIGE